MDYTATGPRAYIATRSNASAHPNRESVGVAVDVVLVIEELNGSPSITFIARQSFHLPEGNIDVAERIGVLVGMDLILDFRDEIQGQKPMQALAYSLLSACISIVSVWNRHSPTAWRLILFAQA